MKVLFLCTGNACRSQMAEGLLRDLSKGQVESYSAGTDPAGVHPLAVEVMAAVCDRVKDACPTWPDAQEDIHWSFQDPAKVEDPDEARLAFVAVRNAIAQRVRLFLLAHRVGVEAERAT